MVVDQFCLKWNNYQHSLTSAFKKLLEEEDFVDVTLSAEGQSLKAHKVVLSACSQYFRDLLRGISLWQHPVLVLRDVPFLDLQSILEFVYLGEVNVEQDRLQSFLKTAELLRIKGLTDGLPDKKEKEEEENLDKPPDIENKEKSPEPVVTPAAPARLSPITPPTSVKRPISALSDDLSPHSSPTKKQNLNPSPEKLNNINNLTEEVNGTQFMTQKKTFENHNNNAMCNVEDDDEDDYDEDEDNQIYDGEHIIVAGDPVTNADFDNSSDYENLDYGPGELVVSLDHNQEKEMLGPLHKRCPDCHMIMLKKNLSRHKRDQHSSDRPRSNCPICQKSYKTPDWLKDHIRRGHGYTKEATDELIAQLNLKLMGTPQKLKTPAGLTPVVANQISSF